MAKRLALVAWWIGALFILCTAIGAVAALFDPRPMNTISNVLFMLVPAVACWAIAFVLGGFFWKPPTSN